MTDLVGLGGSHTLADHQFSQYLGSVKKSAVAQQSPRSYGFGVRDFTLWQNWHRFVLTPQVEAILNISVLINFKLQRAAITAIVATIATDSEFSLSLLGFEIFALTAMIAINSGNFFYSITWPQSMAHRPICLV